MQQTELLMLEDFSSNLEIIETVITDRLSKALKIPNIAINLSPLLNIPLVCLHNKNDPNQISIRDFLKKCITRWHQEVLYQQDILKLKDQIIDEFDKICIHMRDEKLYKIVKEQSQEIVEILFVKTNFDKRHLAGDFCKSFMNGFEIEMIENIDNYATYVVWMPFITISLDGFLEYMKKILHEEFREAKNEVSIMNGSKKIIQYIENELKEEKIQILDEIQESSKLLMEKNVIKINQLDEQLKIAKSNKKSCALIIDEVGKDSNAILSKREDIQAICVKTSANNFLKANIPFTYEYLELDNLEDENISEQTIDILLKLPKCLKSATFRFKQIQLVLNI